MAEASRAGDAPSGEPESKRSLWRALRSVFEGEDITLRAQISEAIAEHEADCSAEHHHQQQGDLTRLERDMLRNLLRFGHRNADDVAIARGRIIALPETASWAEVVAAFAEHGHSRILVYRETLDSIVGMVLIKDVFPPLVAGRAPAEGWLSLLRQPLFVPQARPALDVLADMRARRVHLAVVVDEYSGTEGIVTFEDLVEQIIGEIEDEHDDAPPELLRELPGGAWETDATARLVDVAARLDPRLAEVDQAVDTMGGLAFILAEAVPPVGAHLAHPSGWTLEVTAGDARHVTRLTLHPPADRLATAANQAGAG